MTSPTKVNPSDPRVKRTRQLLKQALTELLAEKPFQDISVQDITERATLNRVTFYAHFEDKYDLVSTWIRDGFVERLETALPADSSLTPDHLRLVCRVVLETLRETQNHCRPIHQRYGPLFESALQEALNTFILDWLRHGSSNDAVPGVAAESLAAVLSWSIFGAGIDWSRTSEAPPVNDVVNGIVSVLLQGASAVFREQPTDCNSPVTELVGAAAATH